MRLTPMARLGRQESSIGWPMDEQERPARAWQWTRGQMHGGRGDERRATCLWQVRAARRVSFRLLARPELIVVVQAQNVLSPGLLAPQPHLIGANTEHY